MPRITRRSLVVGAIAIPCAGFARVKADTEFPTLPANPDYPATISALETQVADLQATITADESPSPTDGLVGRFHDAAEGEPDTAWEIRLLSNSMNATTVVKSSIDPDKWFVAKGAYAIVLHGVTNLGESPQQFPWEALRLVDEQGNAFEYDAEATFSYFIISLGQYPVPAYPNSPVQYVTLFDQPNNGEKWHLTTEDGAFSLPILLPILD